MNVLVPLNNKEHIDDYIKSGATEFYVGFHDVEWEKTFGQYGDINRLTGYRESANPFSFEELLELIPKIQQKGGTVYITFNSSMYSQAQLTYMERYMDPLKHAGVDGVIASCPELIEVARAHDLFCVASTIAGCYNNDIVSYYENAGVGRIILPRDVTMEDMKVITDAHPKLEYEVFIMRCGCMFSDSNCLGMHRNEYCSFCLSLRQAENEICMDEENFAKRSAAEMNNEMYQQMFHYYSCGLCSIYQFLSMNVTAGKIVGRGDDWQKICAEIQLVSDNIKIAEKCKSNEEYLEKMKIPEDHRQRCKMGLSCYYPEVRFDSK